MQSVRRGQVSGLKSRGAHRVRVLGDLADLAVHQLHPAASAARHKAACSTVLRTPRPTPARNGASTRAAAVEIADPVQRAAVRTDTEPVQMREGVRHHALSASLVEHAARRSTTATSSPARARIERGRQPRGPAACHQQVDHVRLASASFSTLIRVRSSAAFSTVNTQRGDPRRMHQRQRDPLEDDRDIIGVRYQAVRPAGDARRTGDHDHAGVPLVPQRA